MPTSNYQPPTHLSPKFEFHSALARLAEQLQKSALVINTSLANQGEVWRAMDDVIRQHCAENRILFANPPSDLVVSEQPAFSDLNWRILAPAVILEGNAVRLRGTDAQIVSHSCTLAKLKSIATSKKLTNPLHPTQPLFFVGEILFTHATQFSC